MILNVVMILRILSKGKRISNELTKGKYEKHKKARNK